MFDTNGAQASVCSPLVSKPPLPRKCVPWDAIPLLQLSFRANIGRQMSTQSGWNDARCLTT